MLRRVTLLMNTNYILIKPTFYLNATRKNVNSWFIDKFFVKVNE